jgi:membrane fusion protein, hemolysin D
LPRAVLYALLALFGLMLVWACLGRLDIVAVTPGKLVPQSFLKIVQPAEPGIVRDILVKEGDVVKEGQVLVRMDTRLPGADLNILQAELARRDLQLRRIDAELAGTPLKRSPGDRPQLFAQVEAQYRVRRQAYQDALGAEQAVLAKARQDLQTDCALGKGVR